MFFFYFLCIPFFLIFIISFIPIVFFNRIINILFVISTFHVYDGIKNNILFYIACQIYNFVNFFSCYIFFVSYSTVKYILKQEYIFED